MSYFNSRQLLRRAHSELDAAHLQSSPREQFLHAHMAALRGAAAVLAINPAVVSPARRKVRSAWVQLAEAGEEWGPWVEFYLASAATRASLESGQLREIDVRTRVRPRVPRGNSSPQWRGTLLATKRNSLRWLKHRSLVPCREERGLKTHAGTGEMTIRLPRSCTWTWTRSSPRSNFSSAPTCA